MVKRIRLSDDDATYYTLPGNSGEISNESGNLPDTIFGQNFQSNFPGLIGWQVQANGIFKGFAGYQVGLKITGAGTAMTDEAMTLVAGKTYKIADATKEIWDRTSTIVVEDDASPVLAANIESFDYLFGQVTFVPGYTVVGVITISGDYLPTSTIAGSRTFTLTQTANAVDDTTIPSAQANDGHRDFSYGLKTVSMDLSGVYALSNDFLNLLKSRDEYIIEINPDAAGLATARGIFRFTKQAQAGNVGELEEETLGLTLSVPDDDKSLYPFAWNIKPASTLSVAIQKAIDSWQNETELFVSYYPENATEGLKGNCIITDLSMSGGLEAMNEFTVNCQGSGAPTVLS